MVSRPAQVWQCAPWRLWNGHRAGSGVDLRVGACAGDHSVSADAESLVPVNLIYRRGRRERREWPRMAENGRKRQAQFDCAADHWGGDRGTSTFGSRLAESVHEEFLGM